MSIGNPEESYGPEPMRPEYLEREPRLKVLDAQGVSRCLLFPGAIALSAEYYMDDTEAMYANVASYNRWFNETWGFNYQDRIYATALLSLRDLDKAVENAEDIINRGAKAVLLPTGPANGRSPGDPYFDPVWSRLNEAGVVIAMHIMPNWYFERDRAGVGPEPGPGFVAHVGLGMDEHVRRAAGHRHPVGADLRQSLWAVPEAQCRCRRARRELGPAHAEPYGQEPRYGPQRAVDRRQAHRAAVGDLQTPCSGDAVSGGRRGQARRSSRR